MKTKLKTTRTLTVEQHPWLDNDIKQGTTVYRYFGNKYGCIGPNGIGVTLVEGKEPFFEVPIDSVI
jgi:hypothetical protein